MNEIYDPQEDSFLLEKYVKEYALGKVLDMGTGSGIQGFAALQCPKVTDVTFADRNPDAIERLIARCSERTTFIITDLFQNILAESKYDTIIFNPPYLPEDCYDQAKDITTGGKKGHELLALFLKQAKNYIKDGGIILIVFSSLTGKRKVDSIIKSLDYNKATLAKERIFMEELYVYMLTPKLCFKGHRGNVCTLIHKHNNKFYVAVKKSAIKVYNSSKEAKFLRKLNKKNIAVKMFKHDKKNNCIIMEYARGKRIMEYFKCVDKQEIMNQISLILAQLWTMDNLGINKLEMTNPYKHILLTPDKPPVLIDFERAYQAPKEKVKNITQFIQFLASGRISYLFKEKKIALDIVKVRNIAAKYKKNTYPGIIKDVIMCFS